MCQNVVIISCVVLVQRLRGLIELTDLNVSAARHEDMQLEFYLFQRNVQDVSETFHLSQKSMTNNANTFLL